MKTTRTHFAVLFTALISILTLTSCDPDFWGSSNVEGTWRIVEVSGYSNYRTGDYWELRYNGDFYAYGSGNLNESGYWDRYGRTLNIRFDGSGADMQAYVRQYEGDYMVLEVNDYSFQTSYTLRLTRQSYY